jgi:hypothetical protein
MFKIRSTTQLAAAVLASGCFALALGARAEATEMKAASSACESARLSAWFERQRQITDGATNAFQEIATPRECARTNGASAADEAKPRNKVAAASKAPQQLLRWDFEGRLSGQ